MRRRVLMTALGSAAVTAPFAARAQQKTMPVIGILSPGPPITSIPPTIIKPYLDAAREGLDESGYVEGQNVTIELRFAEGHYDRLPALAADLVARKVAVIETTGLVGAQAAKDATSTIPIVFNAVGDPVGDGLIASLARPGGNVTGATDFSLQLPPKFLDLLAELVPGARTTGLLVNPSFRFAAELFIRNMREAAGAKGVDISIQNASTEGEIDGAFAAFAQAKPDALIVMADVFFLNRVDQIVALASRHAIPTIYYNVRYPRAGGLICYGVDEVAVFGRAFYYVGKILNGANPAEMPIERPTKFILAVNLKAANALGLTVPQSILGQATEVIE
jgi:putative tryptophan/tyrosine transport system substrate-binding protein